MGLHVNWSYLAIGVHLLWEQILFLLETFTFLYLADVNFESNRMSLKEVSNSSIKKYGEINASTTNNQSIEGTLHLLKDTDDSQNFKYDEKKENVKVTQSDERSKVKKELIKKFKQPQ